MTTLVGTIFHGYQVLRQIGSGGMSEVYLAKDLRLSRLVALKMLHPGPPDAASRLRVRRFREEMRLVAALSHPHILPIYTDGYARMGETTLWYMVMPYCAGGSLAQFLAQFPGGQAFSPRLVVALTHQVADALAEAHRHGITHLDVKAANLLLRHPARHPALPDLLLADFGIARMQERTEENVRWGTPHIMAPEQWQGAPEAASDQYALAVLAYRLLTGRAPFIGSLEQLCFQHLSRMPAAPSQLSPALPPQVDAVLLRALSKTPAERFASVCHFAQALHEALSLDPSGSDARGILPSVEAIQPPESFIQPENAAATTITCSPPSPAWTPITTPYNDTDAPRAMRMTTTQPAASRLPIRDQTRVLQKNHCLLGSSVREGEPRFPPPRTSRLPETGWFAGAGSVLFVVGGCWIVQAVPVESVGLVLMTLLGILGIGGGIWLDCQTEQRRRHRFTFTCHHRCTGNRAKHWACSSSVVHAAAKKATG